MDGIKKLFDKIKKDTKFKKAGQGKSLSSSSQHSAPRRPAPAGPRQDPTASAQRAGQAALSRFSSNSRNTQVDWSMQAIKAQARRELEAEKRLTELSVSEAAAAAARPGVVHLDAAPVQHVMFSSPLMGGEIDQFEAVKASIRTVLYNQLEEDKAMAACLIVHSCNKGTDKVAVCCETLCKYIENIVHFPDEEKYRKIRQSNKAYQERILPIEGATMFLEASGFTSQELPFNDTTDKFWVFPADGDLNLLESLRASLMVAEPVRPVLERSTAVLLPQQANRQPNLPPEFFTISKEEIQKEQQLKNELVEQSMQLRTKAMRERRNQRELRKYRFTFVRVRFPDGLTLQGTFRIGEKLADVKSFIREYLVNEWRPFCLLPSGGKKYTEEDDSRTLAEHFLVPTALLNFQWDSDIRDDNLDDMQLLGPAAYDLIQQPTEEEP